MQRADAVFIPMHDGLINKVVFTDNSVSTSENGEGGMAIASTSFDISSSTENRFVVYMKYEGTETPDYIHYGGYSGLATILNANGEDMPIAFSPLVYYEAGVGLAKDGESDPEILYADWNPHEDSVAFVMDFDKEEVEVWTSRNNGTKEFEQSFADIEQRISDGHEVVVTIDKDLVTLAALNTYFPVEEGGDYRLVNSGKMSAAKTFDVSPSAVDVFESTQVVDLTPPTDAANNAFILNVANPVFIPELGKELESGDIVFFDGDSVPFRYIPKEIGGGEVLETLTKTFAPWQPEVITCSPVDFTTIPELSFGGGYSQNENVFTHSPTEASPDDFYLATWKANVENVPEKYSITYNRISTELNAPVVGYYSGVVIGDLDPDNEIPPTVGFNYLMTDNNDPTLLGVDNYFGNSIVDPAKTLMTLDGYGAITAPPPGQGVDVTLAIDNSALSASIFYDGVLQGTVYLLEPLIPESIWVSTYELVSEIGQTATVTLVDRVVEDYIPFTIYGFGAGGSTIDETKYPEKPEGKGYEIVGLAQPTQWNELGKEVKNGDLIVFDNDGLPRILGEDVDLSDYAKKSDLADVAFSGKASDLENDAGFLTTQGLDDFALGVEDVEIGGMPIGYEGMITYDKFPDHTFGILKSKSLNEVNYEQSLLVINDNNQYHSIGTRIVNADLQTITGVEFGINRNTPEMNSNIAGMEVMSNPNNLGFASIYAVNAWDTTNSNEIVESGVKATGLSFTFNGFNVSHFVDVPASSSATGTKGQLAADADYLYYCYAEDSWATVPKTAFKTALGSMAFLDDAASDGKTYARKDGTWVEVVDKPRMPIPLIGDIAVNNADNHSDLFVVPSSQSMPILITLGDPSVSEMFEFKVHNNSIQNVTFTDGYSQITDVHGNNSILPDGIVTVTWTGTKWKIHGELEMI